MRRESAWVRGREEEEQMMRLGTAGVRREEKGGDVEKVEAED